MSNMNQCPSCGVKPVILKIATKGNGHLQFRHLDDCKIGRATRDSRCDYAPVHRYHCLRCGAKFTLSSEVFLGYTDGGGTASLDCPICWATVEAVKKI